MTAAARGNILARASQENSDLEYMYIYYIGIYINIYEVNGNRLTKSSSCAFLAFKVILLLDANFHFNYFSTFALIKV